MVLLLAHLGYSFLLISFFLFCYPPIGIVNGQGRTGISWAGMGWLDKEFILYRAAGKEMNSVGNSHQVGLPSYTSCSTIL